MAEERRVWCRPKGVYTTITNDDKGDVVCGACGKATPTSAIRSPAF